MSLPSLDYYHPIVIPYQEGSRATFLIEMVNARDVILADIATDLTKSNNKFYYSGSVWKCHGCDKFFSEEREKWFARLTGAIKEK